ncbi:hypothetical protein [Oceanicola sp. S124]|uniref:hypothetical protein n=1 Tax=Oceanicola sp. S124 TaxID=1042378 RepID=UPI0002559CA4|nr:hypothetical protein [Oceanicola sp. S124]
MGRRTALRRVDRIALWLVLAPLGCWVLAIAVTLGLTALGCQIDEGSAHSCPLLGVELADFAYSTGVFAAWGGLLVLPLSGGFALLWGIVRLMLALALPKTTPPEDH